MLSRQTRVLLTQLSARSLWNSRSYAIEASKSGAGEKDPAEYFFNTEVQAALKKLTRMDYERVFRHRKTGEPIRKPIYKFMTDEQLNRQMLRAQEKAEQLLQMPPVLKPREEIDKVYSEDYVLQGFDTAKYVFTDISYGISDRKRLIAVRDPNGILRAAKWDERQRMNQVYFPSPFREMDTPEMFGDENLTDLLNRKEYEFILDRACVQFDPDDPDYQRIAKKVYTHVNKNKDFDKLRSTRHFGCLVFHLLWDENIDNLLLDLLQTKELDEAVLLVQLYYKFHPSDDLVVNELINNGGIELVEAYVHIHSRTPQKLSAILNEYYARKSNERE